MKELIKITEHEGKQAVSARNLYEFLGATERFSSWSKRMFRYGFIESLDYVGCKQFNTLANQEITDYILTLDCAKEISMLQRSEKGKTARQYFIACEKRLKEIVKPLSQLEIIAQSAQILLEQDKRLSTVEQKINLLEAKTTTRPEYFTVAGYASLHKTPVNLKQAAHLGRQAADLCKKTMQPIDSCFDPRFGKVNMYPASILDAIFSRPIIY